VHVDLHASCVLYLLPHTSYMWKHRFPRVKDSTNLKVLIVPSRANRCWSNLIWVVYKVGHVNVVKTQRHVLCCILISLFFGENCCILIAAVAVQETSGVGATSPLHNLQEIDLSRLQRAFNSKETACLAASWISRICYVCSHDIG